MLAFGQVCRAMKVLPLLLVAVLLGISGCALPVSGVSKSLLDQIAKGDSRNDVVRVFGRPPYRYHKGNTEFYLYNWDEDGDGRADSRNRLVVMMVEGRVYDKGVEDRETGEIRSTVE